MSDIPILVTFTTSDRLHQRWRDRILAPEWAAAYPWLFDHDDLRIANTQAHLGYHYFEWLSAVLLFHTRGVLSLVEKYTFRSHARKRRVVESLCDARSVRFLLNRGRESLVQCPDLLVYKPDLSDWFFCEVKGPRDSLREEQLSLFDRVREATGKRVFVADFVEADRTQKAA